MMFQIASRMVFIAICMLYICNTCTADKAARWCTISPPEQKKCERMKMAFSDEGLSPAIMCVNRASREECMSAIANDVADLITLDGGDVYSGGEKYDVKPIMEEIYANDKKGYYALAVVRKSNTGVTINNLEGKKTCHTGYGRTAGWNIPVGYLLEENIMPSLACKSSLMSASSYFSQSCVPGALDAAPAGVNVSNLCALCDSPASCSRSDDGYASYVGALRCLVEADADVAFIKKETVLENTDGNNRDQWASGLRSEDFEILCKDGTRRAITEDADCHLAPSPSHAVVTSSSKSDVDISSYVSLLQRAVELFGVDGNSEGFSLFDSATWSEADLLFKDTTETLGELSSDSYQDFLGDEYIESLDGLMACPDGTLRFCTISDGEQEKCLAMMDSFSTVGITPSLSCFPASSHSDCIIAIAGGNADLVTLDGGDIYQAGKNYGLVPVMGEDYGTGDASYWAVAVAKSDTSFTINDLKGKKSCHTGIMKTSGWIVPVGFLVENGHLTVKNCDGAAAVGEFFEQSCAPGALSDKYNPYGTNPESLCDLCVGEGDDNCVRNDHEPYYDYSGSFRCLVEGAGDVAFVKQVTVDDNINPSNPAEWNENLSKSDYRFLCPDGSRQQDWTMECSLGKVSSHALMTSAEKTQGEIEEIKAVFTTGQNRYGSDTGNDFKLFDSQDYEGSDLLFKDSTNTLQDVGNKDTYDKWLSEEYINGLESLDPAACSGVSNGMTLFVLAAVLAIAHALVGGGA